MSSSNSVRSSKPIVYAQAAAEHKTAIKTTARAVVEGMKEEMRAKASLSASSGFLDNGEIGRAVFDLAQKEFKGFDISAKAAKLEHGKPVHFVGGDFGLKGAKFVVYVSSPES